MKKILLISDTHGALLTDVMKHVAEADEVWHAGDWGGGKEAFTMLENTGKTIRGVYGNIDGTFIRTVCPENLFFVCEGLKVWITHIGGYPGRYAKGIKQQLIQHKPDLFICGHSHILKVQRDPELKVMHFNPGAAGVHGFHKYRTMLRFEIEDSKIQNLVVIELGLRAV